MKSVFGKYRKGVFRLTLVLAILTGFLSVHLYRLNLNINVELINTNFKLKLINSELKSARYMREFHVPGYSDRIEKIESQSAYQSDYIKKLKSQLKYLTPFEILHRYYVKKEDLPPRCLAIDFINFVFGFVFGFGFMWFIYGVVVFVLRGFRRE